MREPSQHFNNSTSQLLLAIETSCDETAVAIMRGRDRGSVSELLTSEVASQIAQHRQYGGVVPEVASRDHLLHAPRLIDDALRHAKIDIADVDAFAATSGPGLASSLMIGASIAKGLAIALTKPYLAINHLEGHLLSPFLVEGQVDKHVSLIVSGGHTVTVFVRRVGDYETIGRTVDDAAGEAFDKVAKLLGLGYPGGPQVENFARQGDSNRFDFPRSMPESVNFSFSGLKTAVRYLLPKIGASIPGASHRTDAAHRLEDRVLADLCASFQQAVIDVLVRKTIAAAKHCNVNLVTLSGGVSCNQELRRQMAEACEQAELGLKVAEPWLCTDNAAMIAFAALLRLRNGFTSDVAAEIDPNLTLR